MAVVPLAVGTVDLDTGRVIRPGGESVQLTSSERALLVYFTAHPNEDLHRERLHADVWGYGAGVRTRTLDTTVKTLRRKIEVDPRAPDHLHTVFGTGYRFTPVRRDRPEDLIGRSGVLDVLDSELTAGRSLATVTGPGGVGKTRVALEATRHLARTCVVGLAEVRDGVGFEAAIALALGLRDSRPLVARLAAHRPLLVLDNLEQVVEPARIRIERWLREAPGLQVIATSRVALELGDELVIPLSPLPPPDAMALLRRRLEAVRPALAEATDAQLAPIVAALDGLPLAIELAAGRAAVLTLDELRARLHHATFLRRSDGPERHRSVTELVEWSWDLLPPAEQQALAACAAFVGPFTATDAGAVLGADAVDLLEALFRASLLTRSADHLGMLDVVRRFAEGRCDDLAAVSVRHAVHVLNLVEGAPVLCWADRAGELHAIGARCADRPDLQARAALARATLYSTVGLGEARLAAADAAVEASERAGSADLVAAAHLTRGAARLAASTSTFDDHAVALARALRTHDAVREAAALAHFGTFYRLRGQLEPAARWLTEASRLAEPGPPQIRAEIAAELGLVAREEGRFEDALERFDWSLAAYREARVDAGCALTMHRIGTTHLTLGHAERAQRWFEEALEAYRAVGSVGGELSVRGSLAWLDLEVGRIEVARQGFDWCESRLDEYGTLHHRALIYAHQALTWLELGEVVRARQQAAASLDTLPRRPGHEWELLSLLTVALVEIACGGDGRPGLDRAIAHGRDGHPSPELVYGLCYRSLVVAQSAAADRAEAERLVAGLRDHAARRAAAVVSRGERDDSWLHARRLGRLRST